MNAVQKVDMLYAYLINTCAYALIWEKNRANMARRTLIYGEEQCSDYAKPSKEYCADW